jgi:toxin ParE1/3/4
MVRCRFSRSAKGDLLGIGRYTVRAWGGKQAAAYIADLEKFCTKLAETPEIGRRCDEIRAGLRRLERSRHVVFYRREPGGVVIVRILHQRMLPESYLWNKSNTEE